MSQAERDYRDAFVLFDQDCDGLVSKKELQLMMKKLGNEVTDAEVNDIITESGSSNSSGITYPEFQKLMGMGVKNLREPEDPEDELRLAFRLFDVDGDGFISAKELTTALSYFGGLQATEKEVDQVISEATHSADRRINYDVFKRVMMSH
mmetsp:Transcript_23866/g.48505  ORF Transcript_23866/g.48505 Transcript_23866/m.48505 type:complete len:150 (-) Transcript_23866:205-654(-)